MARVIDVKNSSENLHLKSNQLAVPLEDQNFILLKICEICRFCEGHDSSKENSAFEQDFKKYYNDLSRREVSSASIVTSKSLLSKLVHLVACIGCRRSCERLYNQIRSTDSLSLHPFLMNKNGNLTVGKKYSLQDFCKLFSSHRPPLHSLLESVPKVRKSGRCMLHSIEGVKYRPGSQIWFEVWESLTEKCTDALSLIPCDKLLTCLNNYLLKHRFCLECKNKVLQAYDVLVSDSKAHISKENGYSSSLYDGIFKCSEGHLHVKNDIEFITRLMKRAEPDIIGRRERHAKTPEVAQEEILICLGLFLYERIQRVYLSMKEEVQSYYILFHVALDTLKQNFEVAYEEKHGISKFELLCEELHKQEGIHKSKKEKRKKKKKVEVQVKKNGEEIGVDDSGVSTSELMSDDQVVPSSIKTHEKDFDIELSSDDQLGDWQVVGKAGFSKKSSYNNEKSRLENQHPENYHSTTLVPVEPKHSGRLSSQLNLLCSISVDSLNSKCSQCSKDVGYCSLCSTSSSCNSSDVACGDAYCSHFDDLDVLNEDSITEPQEIDSNCNRNSTSPLSVKHSAKQCLSLQEMLNDFSSDTDEIPESEVMAWHARLSSVKQMREELRMKLRQQFSQLCHRKNPISAKENA